MRYFFKTTTILEKDKKPVVSINDDLGYVGDIRVQAETIEDAIKQYLEIVEIKYHVIIGKKAMEELAEAKKQHLYDECTTLGFHFRGRMEKENEDMIYLRLCVEIYKPALYK